MTGVLSPIQAAKSALRALGSETEATLARLGPPAERSASARAAAADAHRTVRRARRRFLRDHVATVYAEITDDLTRPLRLAELLDAAARRFPGLVPDPAAVALDAGRLQADKEGWEIDHGIFFAAVFGHPESGRHLLDSARLPSARALCLIEDYTATGRLDLEAVSLRRVDGVSTVTMCNLYCLNAEDNQHVADMETAVDLVLLDPSSAVGVVRGAEMTHSRYRGRRVFSAGINLAHLHEGRISYIDFLLGREVGYISKVLRGIELGEEHWPHLTSTKPWIAAVDTFAIGGGAQLLMVFDRVIAAADSYVSLPAAQEGIIPGAGNLRLTRSGRGRLARDVILWGRRLHAREPESACLIDTVVEPAEMDGAIERAALRLASPAVATNKAMLVGAEEPLDEFRTYMAHFALQQGLRIHGADVLSKVRRFHSKDVPA